MDRRWAILLQLSEVGTRRVAFMASKSIVGILSVEFQHDLIPDHFGDNGSSSNREAKAVSTNYRIMRHGQALDRQAIHESVLCSIERLNGFGHRLRGGPEDVQRINLGNFAPGNCVQNTRVILNFAVKGLTTGGA